MSDYEILTVILYIIEIILLISLYIDQKKMTALNTLTTNAAISSK